MTTETPTRPAPVKPPVRTLPGVTVTPRKDGGGRPPAPPRNTADILQ